MLSESGQWKEAERSHKEKTVRGAVEAEVVFSKSATGAAFVLVKIVENLDLKQADRKDKKRGKVQIAISSLSLIPPTMLGLSLLLFSKSNPLYMFL